MNGKIKKRIKKEKIHYYFSLPYALCCICSICALCCRVLHFSTNVWLLTPVLIQVRHPRHSKSRKSMPQCSKKYSLVMRFAKLQIEAILPCRISMLTENVGKKSIYKVIFKAVSLCKVEMYKVNLH